MNVYFIDLICTLHIRHKYFSVQICAKIKNKIHKVSASVLKNKPKSPFFIFKYKRSKD